MNIAVQGGIIAVLIGVIAYLVILRNKK